MMKKVSKIKIIVLVIIVLAGFSWYLWEFRCVKSFESLVGTSGIESITIFENDETVKLNDGELKMLYSIFEDREYLRIDNEEIVFKKEFPEGIFTIQIYMYYGNKGRFIMPLRDRVLINSKMYKVNPPIEDQELKDLYESIESHKSKMP